jgi:transcription termination factor Rho
MRVEFGTLDRPALEGKVLPELQAIAEGLGISGHQRLRKSDLIDAILEQAGQGNGARGEDRESADVAPVPAAEETDGPEAGNGSGRGSSQTRTRTRPSEAAAEDSESSSAEGGEQSGGDGQARGGTRTDTRDREPPRQDQQDGGGEFRGGGQGPQGQRRRMSRDERRRQREERREREREQREQELAEAPVRTGLLDILPEG